MTKKTRNQVTKEGAVDLEENQLDDAQGGILIGLNQGFKIDLTAHKDAPLVKFDTSLNAPIGGLKIKF